MREGYSISDQSGFTISEVMVVVAIVGVLATISFASYVMFGDKAKTVEAEIALAEVNRREMLYMMRMENIRRIYSPSGIRQRHR
jgi:prepilin-type N-terminal cleavage/methylation domain-containing protein